MNNIEIMSLRKVTPTHEYDVRIDRGTPLGNPFYMYDESVRDAVCDKYASMPKSESWHDEIFRIRDLYIKHGKLRLFCWCAPKRCHGEYIKECILVDMF